MKNSIRFLLILILLPSATKKVYSEPFVVLEYRNETSKLLDQNKNPFLTNQKFSKKYKVKKNETLSDIILKNYGIKHFNKDILTLSIVHFNKHAFVRKNPNFLFADKTLYLPSVDEMKNLIIKREQNKIFDSEDEKHIYFFGG